MQKNMRIKILRILRGYSQGTLAQLIGVKQPSLAAYEKGTYDVPERTLLRLADQLLVDPAYLTYGYPALQGKVWEIAKEGKGLQQDINNLLPIFLEENKVTRFMSRRLLDCDVFLLISDDKRYSLLISSTLEISAAITLILYGGESIYDDVMIDLYQKPRLRTDVLMRNFDISSFGIKNLDNDYFSWPPDFFSNSRLPTEIKLVLEFVLESIMPSVINESINTGVKLPLERIDLYIKSVIPRLKILIDSRVEESLANRALNEFDSTTVSEAFKKAESDYLSSIEAIKFRSGN